MAVAFFTKSSRILRTLYQPCLFSFILAYRCMFEQHDPFAAATKRSKITKSPPEGRLCVISGGSGANATDAIEWLDRAITRLVEGDGYNYLFDLAVREWARADKRAKWAVERADRGRLETLQKFFEALGYESESASIRARIFYCHQIGYYVIGIRQRVPERYRDAWLYLDVLCGSEMLSAARESAKIVSLWTPP